MAKTTAIARRMPKGAGQRPEESAAAPVSDLGDIMTHFNEALALLVVCQRSMLENDDDEGVHDAVHEEIVLRAAIAKFRDVYDEIDAADFRMRLSPDD
jgi:hypothetical protein